MQGLFEDPSILFIGDVEIVEVGAKERAEGGYTYLLACMLACSCNGVLRPGHCWAGGMNVFLR